jgi:COP9 signalosome complex subunit 5
LYEPQITDQAQAVLQSTKPWTKDANYFQNVHVSSLALLKMALHAQSGGSIEIMGMLTGKIVQNGIVVMDVYPLPVEGTETRVNAQAEGYEFMVQYLDSLRKSGRYENIVGWYHSHPGYGCWLSGIDVGTQSLNQQFQDPYLAIVVDPIRTTTNGKVEIGAFRTYSEEYVKNNINNANFGSFGSLGASPASKGKEPKKKKDAVANMPVEKVKDFGLHSSKYYALSVDIFRSNVDHMILSNLWNKFWISSLVGTDDLNEQRERFQEFLDFRLEALEKKITLLKRPAQNMPLQSQLSHQSQRRAPPQVHHSATSLRELAQQSQANIGSGSQLSPFSRANWLARLKEKELDTDESDLEMNEVDSDSESRNDDDSVSGSRPTRPMLLQRVTSPAQPSPKLWGLQAQNQLSENAKNKEQNEQVRTAAAEASRKLMNLKVQKMVFLNE